MTWLVSIHTAENSHFQKETQKLKQQNGPHMSTSQSSFHPNKELNNELIQQNGPQMFPTDKQEITNTSNQGRMQEEYGVVPTTLDPTHLTQPDTQLLHWPPVF